MQRSIFSQAALVISVVNLCCVPVVRADDNKLDATAPVLKLEGSNGENAPAAQPAAKEAAKAAKPSKPKVAKGKKPAAKVKAKPKLGAVTPINDFELGRYQYCGADSDCVVANNGCCDCANGGKDVAVNKERLADFQKRFDCLYAKCGDKRADPICGSGVVSCVMHKCQYFPPGEGMEDRF